MNLENLGVQELNYSLAKEIDGGCFICSAAEGLVDVLAYVDEVLDDLMVATFVATAIIMAIGAGISDGFNEGLK